MSHEAEASELREIFIPLIAVPLPVVLILAIASTGRVRGLPEERLVPGRPVVLTADGNGELLSNKLEKMVGEKGEGVSIRDMERAMGDIVVGTGLVAISLFKDFPVEPSIHYLLCSDDRRVVIAMGRDIHYSVQRVWGTVGGEFGSRYIPVYEREGDYFAYNVSKLLIFDSHEEFKEFLVRLRSQLIDSGEFYFDKMGIEGKGVLFIKVFRKKLNHKDILEYAKRFPKVFKWAVPKIRFLH